MMVLLIEVVEDGGNGTNLPYQWTMRSTTLMPVSCPQYVSSVTQRAARQIAGRGSMLRGSVRGWCGEGPALTRLGAKRRCLGRNRKLRASL